MSDMENSEGGTNAEKSLSTSIDPEIRLDDEAIVYVLERKTETPVVKVGHTKNTADGRASSYTDGNWAASFEKRTPVYLARVIEKTAHDILKSKNLWLDPAITSGSAREIFTCDVETAQLAVEEACQIVSDHVQNWTCVQMDSAKQLDNEMALRNELRENERILRENNVLQIENEKLRKELEKINTELQRKNMRKVNGYWIEKKSKKFS